MASECGVVMLPLGAPECLCMILRYYAKGITEGNHIKVICKRDH